MSSSGSHSDVARPHPRCHVRSATATSANRSGTAIRRPGSPKCLDSVKRKGRAARGDAPRLCAPSPGRSASGLSPPGRVPAGRPRHGPAARCARVPRGRLLGHGPLLRARAAARTGEPPSAVGRVPAADRARRDPPAPATHRAACDRARAGSDAERVRLVLRGIAGPRGPPWSSSASVQIKSCALPLSLGGPVLTVQAGDADQALVAGELRMHA